jgi:pilus assembly protein CpaE
MFKALIIGATPERCLILQSSAVHTDKILVMRLVESYPDRAEVFRIARSLYPEVVILDEFEPTDTVACVHAIREAMPAAAIVGISPHPQGNSASLPYPPNPELLVSAIEKAICAVRGEVQENLFAFLPAKAGVGASTIALNTAWALVNGHGKKVLLIEGDLRSGVVSIMLGISPAGSIQQLLASEEEVDGFQLSRYITKYDGLDMLLTTRTSSVEKPGWEKYYRLLDLVHGKYDFVLTDLPELINPATREVVRRANRVFNVCTPELLAVKLAERRCQDLSEWEVPDGRVHILLNRWTKNELNSDEIAEAVQRSVDHVFPNDYAAVRSAMTESRCVAPGTPLGRSIAEFAGRLCGKSSSGARPSSNGISRLRDLLSR